MKYLLKQLILISVIFLWSQAFSMPVKQPIIAERNDFQFVIPHYKTLRQGGQIVNLYIRYAYKKGLPDSKYVDYRLMREDLLEYMEPTDEFPENTYWELIATKMGRELMAKYPLAGVSVFLEVLDNPDGQVYEPGDHGPIYTLGDIAPLTWCSR